MDAPAPQINRCAKAGLHNKTRNILVWRANRPIRAEVNKSGPACPQ
ncbi:MAG: hypothetical protein GPOALKHO_000287 [Sodalis sp.]|nr:MAG: hypothetical protein GPOALKHO_000287 [Sodalis sp.]